MIPLREQEYLRERFAQELVAKVRIDYFTQRTSSLYVPGREECLYCEDTRKMLAELAALTDKISLTVHELVAAREKAAKLGVDKAPCIVLWGANNRRVTFYGIPGGNEFPVFIDTIVDASKGALELSQESRRQLRKLKEKVSITVFVTPTCSYCPMVARAACRLALASSQVRATVVEVNEFPRLAQRYGVGAVPAALLNDRTLVVGAMDEAALLERALKAAEEGALASGEARVGAASAAEMPVGPKRGGHLILP